MTPLAPLLLMLLQSGPATPASDAPPAVRNGLPGTGHQALRRLAGVWSVRKTIWLKGPSAPPATAVLTARRRLIAGGRYLEDVTQGEVAGQPYFRTGLLGYSNMDKRYEWVTADATNANMMIYLGRDGSGPGFPIDAAGRFTDQGLLGSGTTGKPVAMRVRFTSEGANRNTLELYFTPPGAVERLFDRSVYTRRR